MLVRVVEVVGVLAGVFRTVGMVVVLRGVQDGRNGMGGGSDGRMVEESAAQSEKSTASL